jgi:hypothetical protein
MLEAARDLAAGQEPQAAQLSAAYRVRSGAIVAPAGLPFAQVMMRRFGHPAGRFDLAAQRVAEPALP